MLHLRVKTLKAFALKDVSSSSIGSDRFRKGSKSASCGLGINVEAKQCKYWEAVFNTSKKKKKKLSVNESKIISDLTFEGFCSSGCGHHSK